MRGFHVAVVLEGLAAHLVMHSFQAGGDALSGANADATHWQRNRISASGGALGSANGDAPYWQRNWIFAAGDALIGANSGRCLRMDSIFVVGYIFFSVQKVPEGIVDLATLGRCVGKAIARIVTRTAVIEHAVGWVYSWRLQPTAARTGQVFIRHRLKKTTRVFTLESQRLQPTAARTGQVSVGIGW